MIAVLGFWEIGLGLRSTRRWLRGATAALLLLLGVWFVKDCVAYYRYRAAKFSQSSGGWMQYGFKEMMEYISAEHGKYKGVTIVATYLHYQPYIFALLYSGMPCREWQEQQRLPWGLQVSTRLPAAGQLEPEHLYIYAPVPAAPDPRLRRLRTFTWEDGRSAAFAAYVLEPGGTTPRAERMPASFRRRRSLERSRR